MPGVGGQGANGPFGLSGRNRVRLHEVNRVRFPSSGTASYSAISEFSGAFSAAKAADGNNGTEWAASGVPAGAWWQVTWSDPQSLNRVFLWDRPSGADYFGSTGVLSFSDGSTVAYSGLPDGATRLEISFPEKVGMAWMRVTTNGGSGSNIGLQEVEAY